MSEDETVGHRELLQDFIESYRNENCLWMTTYKDYHDRNKKNAACDRLIEKYKPIGPNATRDRLRRLIIFERNLARFINLVYGTLSY